MKLSAAFSVALVYGSSCAALKGIQNLNVESPEIVPRAGSGTCSIGIGRESGSVRWDVTVYNVPQSQRQDVNIISTLTYAHMDKGDSITVKGPSDITITNVDNAPVFNYDIPDLKAPLDNPNAFTKVKLQFKMGDTTWDTGDCGAANVAFTAGREGWSCDFPCTFASQREL